MLNIHRYIAASKTNFGPLCFLTTGLLIPYLYTLKNDFVDWDDVQNFVRNPWIASPSWASFKWSLTATHLGVFQPLSWIFIQMQSWLFGVKPDVFHGVSLSLHLAIALILYFLCLDIARHIITRPSLADHRDRWIIATAVLLVMLHPLRVEVVAWSSCQPYLLAIFFAVLGFRAYLRSNTDELGHPQKKSRSALLFFSLSCLSKTLILALPMILLILDYYPLKRFHKTSLKNLVGEKIPYAVLSLVTLTLGLWAHGLDQPFLTLEEMTLKDRVIKVGLAISHYGTTMTWPVNLAAFYPNPSTWVLSPKALFGLGLIVTLLCASIKYRQKCPGFFSTTLIVGFWLIPHIGIIPNGRVIAADRYTYLAAVSMAPLFAYILRTSSRKSPIAHYATCLLLSVTLAFYVVTTRSQLATWKNSLTLWNRALEISAQANAEIHFNVAHSLRALGRDQKALPHYQTSLAIDPNFEKSLLNLGALYVDLGLPDQAIPLYNKLLEKKPTSAAAHGNLGLAHLAKKDALLAEKHLEQAHLMEPGDSDFAVNLAKYYVLTQRPQKALLPMLNLLKVKSPDPESLLLLGKIYFESAKFPQAEEAWSKGLALANGESHLRQRLQCLLTRVHMASPTAPEPIIPPRPEQTNRAGLVFSPPWSDSFLKDCE